MEQSTNRFTIHTILCQFSHKLTRGTTCSTNLPTIAVNMVKG